MGVMRLLAVCYTLLACTNFMLCDHNGSINLGKCGGNFEAERGLLTSPSYPSNYQNNKDCVYTISQPNDTFIRITILKLDIFARSSAACYLDFLEIRDGSSSESPLMGELCGSGTPLPLKSTQNNVWIRYENNSHTQFFIGTL